jgi:hypothetical protein
VESHKAYVPIITKRLPRGFAQYSDVWDLVHEHWPRFSRHLAHRPPAQSLNLQFDSHISLIAQDDDVLSDDGIRYHMVLLRSRQKSESPTHGDPHTNRAQPCLMQTPTSGEMRIVCRSWRMHVATSSHANTCAVLFCVAFDACSGHCARRRQHGDPTHRHHSRLRCFGRHRGIQHHR